MARATDSHPHRFDVRNLRAFSSEGGVSYYATLTGWLDRGEQALLAAAFDRFPRPRTLDIGVGAGRTVPLLRDQSESYVAVDIGERMVAAARRQHPGTDVRVMDARTLDFPGAAFDLVAFSFNGLDGMPVADRAAALSEIARVTRPGGVFAFSSMNRNGPGFGERFSLTAPRPGKPRATERLRVAAKGVLGYRNYRYNRRFAVTGPDVAVRTSSAHNFAVVLVFTSLTAQVAALARHGFAVEQVFDSATGGALPPDHDDTRSVWLHYLARRLDS